jgi:hypothetical protein
MTNQPQQDPSQAPNGSWRAGVLDVLLGVPLIMVGLALLLPGLCSMALVAMSDDGSLWTCVAMSIGGLWLTIAGLRMAYGWSRR